jgi:hypothetical protein
LELWQELLLAEERGRAQAREISSQSAQPQQITPDPLLEIKRTHLFERNNILVPHSYEIFLLEGHQGEIDEVVVRSTSPDYIVDVNLDHITMHRRSWEEYQGIAEDSEAISAFIRDGKYVLGLKSLYFSEYAKVVLIATGVTFEKIWLKATYV